MSDQVRFAADGIAVLVLVFGLYFPRYRRRDMVLAIIGINVGVLAVATVLSRSEVTAGLGLGLFGVLSIIRLRSQELDQEEIAYYFSAIALGLVGGIEVSPSWVAPVLMGVILLAFFVADHPRLFASNRSHTVTLDSAFTDEVALHAHLESMFEADVLRLKVKKVDLVTDTTVVDIRYRLRANRSAPVSA